MKKRILTISICTALCITSFVIGMHAHEKSSAEINGFHYLNGMSTGVLISMATASLSESEVNSITSQAMEISETGSLQEEVDFLQYLISILEDDNFNLPNQL